MFQPLNSLTPKNLKPIYWKNSSLTDFKLCLLDYKKKAQVWKLTILLISWEEFHIIFILFSFVLNVITSD